MFLDVIFDTHTGLVCVGRCNSLGSTYAYVQIRMPVSHLDNHHNPIIIKNAQRNGLLVCCIPFRIKDIIASLIVFPFYFS